MVNYYGGKQRRMIDKLPLLAWPLLERSRAARDMVCVIFARR